MPSIVNDGGADSLVQEDRDDNAEVDSLTLEDEDVNYESDIGIDFSETNDKDDKLEGEEYFGIDSWEQGGRDIVSSAPGNEDNSGKDSSELEGKGDNAGNERNPGTESSERGDKHRSAENEQNFGIESSEQEGKYDAGNEETGGGKTSGRGRDTDGDGGEGNDNTEMNNKELFRQEEFNIDSEWGAAIVGTDSPEQEGKDDTAKNKDNFRKKSTEGAENKDNNASEENDNRNGTGTNAGKGEDKIERKRSATNAGIYSPEQEERDVDAGNEENCGNFPSLSPHFCDVLPEILPPPLPETGHHEGLVALASKKSRINEKEVEDKDKNKESGDKDSVEKTKTIESERSASPASTSKKRKKEETTVEDGEEDEIKASGDKDSPAKETLLPPIAARGSNDGVLVATSKRKKRQTKKQKTDNGSIPTSTDGDSTTHSFAALQAAAMQNPSSMMLTPQMMMQQRLVHNDLMLRAAHAAGLSMMMTANCGVPPQQMMMMAAAAAASGGGAAASNTNSMASGGGAAASNTSNMASGGAAAASNTNNMWADPTGTAHNCRAVTLQFPVGVKLGMVLDDNADIGRPELKRLTSDSPVKDQIPWGFRTNCFIGYLRSERIGHVQPKTAQECVELITLSKAGVAKSPNLGETAKMEVLLIQMKKTTPVEPPPEKAPKRERSNKSSRAWKKQYNALVQYKKYHGDCNVTPSHNPYLAHWVRDQRQKKEQKKLHPSRCEMMEKIEFDWIGGYNISSSSSKQGKSSNTTAAANQPPMAPWDDMYEGLVRFKTRCGFYPASGNLHHWVERQKEEVEKFRLSPVRARRLLDLELDLPPEFVQKLSRAAGIIVNAEAAGEDKEKQPGSQGESKKKSSALYWKSADAAKLFGFKRGDDIFKELEDRIDLLKKANESVNGWKCLIPKDNKDEDYSHYDIMVVRHKGQYLIKAYLLAMRKMNEVTWHQCCVLAAAELNELGLTKFSGGEGVARWNTQFRVAHTFPHPKRHVAEREGYQYIRIFEYFPTAKEMFLGIANENKEKLTGALMQEEFTATILPALERECREKGCFDNGSKPQKMLKKLIANPPSSALVLKWMGELKIEWDKLCTRKGRAKDGVDGSYLSQRMQEAWASGKYANRRPKGQGMKKGKQQAGDEGDVVMNDLV